MTSADLARVLDLLPPLPERLQLVGKQAHSDGMVADWFKHRDFMLAWARHFGVTVRLPTSGKWFDEVVVPSIRECVAETGCRVGVKAYPFRPDSGWHVNDPQVCPPPDHREEHWDRHKKAWADWITRLAQADIAPTYWIVENEWALRYPTPSGGKLHWSTNAPEWVEPMNECWATFCGWLRAYADVPIHAYGRYVGSGMYRIPGDGGSDASNNLHETWDAAATGKRLATIRKTQDLFPPERKPTTTGWVALCRGYVGPIKHWSSEPSVRASHRVGHEFGTGCGPAKMLDALIPYGFPGCFNNDNPQPHDNVMTSVDIVAFVRGLLGLPLE